MIRKPKNSPNYHYRFDFKGKTYSGSTGTSSRYLATQFESKRRDEVFKEVQLGETEGEADMIILSKAMDTYFDDNKHKSIPTTYKVLRNKTFGRKQHPQTKKMMRVYGLDDINVHMLKERDIQKLITQRRNEGNKDSTILYELTFLNVVLRHVKRLGYMVPDIDWDELKSANALNAGKGRLRFLSLEEEGRLLQELAKDLPNDNVYTKMRRTNALHFIVMSLDVGNRFGELANLKWADIDMNKKTIQLYRSKVDNESALVMTNRVFEVLTDRLTVKAEKQELVFEGKNGTLVCRSALKGACKRAGLVGVSFHTLRHTTASRLVQAGVPIYSVQHVLGHASPSTTQRYAHLSPKQASFDAAQVLNQIHGAQA